MIKLIALLIIVATAFGFPATVVKIADGDTITVSSPQGLTKVRFADVDTPEKFKVSTKAKFDIKQCGEETVVMGRLAGMQLASYIKLDDNVTVSPRGPLSYNREVAIVKLQGVNLNALMVAEGYAYVWHGGRDIKNQRYKKQLLKMQGVAKASKKGFWGTHPDAMSCLVNYHD